MWDGFAGGDVRLHRRFELALRALATSPAPMELKVLAQQVLSGRLEPREMARHPAFAALSDDLRQSASTAFDDLGDIDALAEDADRLLDEFEASVLDGPRVQESPDSGENEEDDDEYRLGPILTSDW